MNNEPVAWMKEVEGGTMYTNYEYPGSIPLYTHPAKYCPSENNEAYEKGFIDGMAKMTESAVHRAVEGMTAKSLTDEEIEEVMYQCDWQYDPESFARAILKKASEK
jgi:hypothetical protein